MITLLLAALMLQPYFVWFENEPPFMTYEQSEGECFTDACICERVSIEECEDILGNEKS